jgi:hypothetical protein
MEMFENLEPLLRMYWYVAIPVSIIFTIQTILTFTGMDASDGLEADFDSDLQGGEAPFQLFSLRNLINFLLGFSWTGISFYSIIESHAWLITLSVAVGMLFVYVFFLIIAQVRKLAEDNSFSIQQTVSKSGDVYLAIPGHKQGKGKVLVSVNGGAFIWPVIQDFAFLDLKPLSIEANLTNALSRQNIRVDVP